MAPPGCSMVGCSRHVLPPCWAHTGLLTWGVLPAACCRLRVQHPQLQAAASTGSFSASKNACKHTRTTCAKHSRPARGIMAPHKPHRGGRGCMRGCLRCMRLLYAIAAVALNDVKDLAQSGVLIQQTRAALLRLLECNVLIYNCAQRAHPLWQGRKWRQEHLGIPAHWHQACECHANRQIVHALCTVGTSVPTSRRELSGVVSTV